MLINQKAIDVYGGKVEFYIKKGYLRKYDSLKIFAEKMNISEYYDNLVLLRNKEGLEKELGQIESDLKKLNCKNVVIDMTK